MDAIRQSMIDKKESPSVMLRFRDQRDLRFGEVDVLVNICTDSIETLPADSIDELARWRAYLKALREYRQALRDVPQQNDFNPTLPDWPSRPEKSEYFEE